MKWKRNTGFDTIEDRRGQGGGGLSFPTGGGGGLPIPIPGGKAGGGIGGIVMPTPWPLRASRCARA